MNREIVARVSNRDAYNELYNFGSEEHCNLWQPEGDDDYSSAWSYILHIDTWLTYFIDWEDNEKLNETRYLLKEAKAQGATWLIVQEGEE